MRWISVKDQLPPTSNSMHIHRVLVWRQAPGVRQPEWSVGWYLESLKEWRLEGSPSRWDDITFWLDPESPSDHQKVYDRVRVMTDAQISAIWNSLKSCTIGALTPYEGEMTQEDWYEMIYSEWTKRRLNIPLPSNSCTAKNCHCNNH